MVDPLFGHPYGSAGVVLLAEVCPVHPSFDLAAVLAAAHLMVASKEVHSFLAVEHRLEIVPSFLGELSLPFGAYPITLNFFLHGPVTS